MLGLCAAVVSAQQRPRPIQPRHPLTLEEALRLAEERNPQLQAAQAGVQGSQAAITTARAYRNPDINVGGFGGQRALMATTPPGAIAGFVVSQPVEPRSLRRARISAAEQGRESSDYGLAEARLVVRGHVKQAFYETLRRKSELDLTWGNLRLIEDLRQRIAAQVNAGEAARLELTRADAEVAGARIQVQSAELRLAGALAALQAAIGVSGATDWDPQGAVDEPVVLTSLEDLRGRVLARHPGIAQAEALRRRSGELLNLERAAVKPTPTFWADVFRQPDAAQYRAGVSFSVPVWDRRAGPIGEAVAAERQAVALAELRRIEVSAALDRAYRQYEIAGQQMQMFEAGTLKSAEAAVEAAEAAFRFGERGVLEVLDAQRVLRAARQDFLNAQYDRQAALIELEQLGAVSLRRP